MNIKNILIVLLALVLGGGAVWILKSEAPNSFGATGSQFHVEHEFVPAATIASGGAVVTASATARASTTPIYFTANSTSTVKILMNGVSDLRINVIAHSTTTAEGAGAELSFRPRILSQGGIDSFFPSVISTSGVAQQGAIIETYFLDASATTTRYTTLSPASDNFYAGSIQISNFNAPYILLDIGASAVADVHLEFVKTITQ